MESSLNPRSLTLATFLSLASVVASYGCGSLASNPAVSRPADQPPTLTAGVAPAPVDPTPDDEFAAVLALDATTSAIRFSDEAKHQVAVALPGLLRPGYGGATFAVNTITANSFDPGNSKLAFRIPGLPTMPARRTTLPRPRDLDLSPCQRNPFNRSACEAQLAAEHQEQLDAAFADEGAAEREWREALAAWGTLKSDRQAEIVAAAEKLDALALEVDQRGTDIRGALLRAAETLSMSQAPKKLVLVASDWVSYGDEQEGELRFPSGTTVQAFFYDCLESRPCFERKQHWTETLLAAGAERVIWLDPAASRLLANPFVEVTR